jgi:(-)-alpha-terpineol synthase
MATTQISTLSNIVRRSANYQPPIWHYDYIQSLTSVYVVYISFFFFFFLFSFLRFFIFYFYYYFSLTSACLANEKIELPGQGESFSGQIDKLKGEVRMMFHKVVDPLERLELIDILQRLGISYHFDNEIQKTLEGIYNANQPP